MTTTKLLPCPMCGSHAEIVEMSSGFYVRCTGKGCDIEQSNYDWTEARASEIWNRRAPVVVTDAMVEAAYAAWMAPGGNMHTALEAAMGAKESK